MNENREIEDCGICGGQHFKPVKPVQTSETTRVQRFNEMLEDALGIRVSVISEPMDESKDVDELAEPLFSYEELKMINAALMMFAGALADAGEANIGGQVLSEVGRVALHNAGQAGASQLRKLTGDNVAVLADLGLKITGIALDMHNGDSRGLFPVPF